MTLPSPEETGFLEDLEVSQGRGHIPGHSLSLSSSAQEVERARPAWPREHAQSERGSQQSHT